MADKPPHWPKSVEPLFLSDFEKLGRNAKNELFWDGQHLVTRNQFIFTWPQKALAFLAALASIATIATGINNASVFLCARGVTAIDCPVLAQPPVAHMIVQLTEPPALPLPPARVQKSR